MGIKTTVCHHRTGRICDFLLLHTVFLYLILQPIIIGVVIAYLLNPIMKFLEGHLLKFLEPRMKSKRKAKKTSRGIAITGSLVFLVGICVLLVAAIVPSISASIQSMI